MLEVCFHYKTTVAEEPPGPRCWDIKKITLLLGGRETGLLLGLIF